LNIVRPDLIILPSVVLSSGINIHVTVTTKIRWADSGQLRGSNLWTTLIHTICWQLSPT